MHPLYILIFCLHSLSHSPHCQFTLVCLIRRINEQMLPILTWHNTTSSDACTWTSHPYVISDCNSKSGVIYMPLQEVPPQYCGSCFYRLIAPPSVTPALEASFFQQTVKTIFLYGSSIVHMTGKSPFPDCCQHVRGTIFSKILCAEIWVYANKANGWIL